MVELRRKYIVAVAELLRSKRNGIMTSAIALVAVIFFVLAIPFGA